MLHTHHTQHYTHTTTHTPHTLHIHTYNYTHTGHIHTHYTHHYTHTHFPTKLPIEVLGTVGSGQKGREKSVDTVRHIRVGIQNIQAKHSIGRPGEGQLVRRLTSRLSKGHTEASSAQCQCCWDGVALSRGRRPQCAFSCALLYGGA